MSIRILIVDNDPLNREVLQGWLEGSACDIDEANKGSLALKMAAQNHYDVVFMNMRMPDMNGPEVAHRIRQHEDTDDNYTPVKIIAVCDRYPKSKHFDWSRNGFNDSIGKPLKDEDIMRAIAL